MNISNEIKIERGEIEFHTLGTLKSLTQWINRHEDGFPEWIKNVRAAYSRINLPEKQKVAVLLFKDANKEQPTRLGVLDVGGATDEDIKHWSVWQDPDASSRGLEKQEETQGNGGKAYMYKLFEGPAYLFGINKDIKNCKGFVGERGSLDRGNPGYIPNKREGKESKISDWQSELLLELSKFDTDLAGLPTAVKNALFERKSFTMAVGSAPVDWDGKDILSFIKRVIRQPQATLAIEQVKFYVVHNGKILFRGGPLELEEIVPHPKFKNPIVYEIPKTLLTREGNQVNTLRSSTGDHSQGKIILYTSKENMSASYMTLKPRWVVTYKTEKEVVGQKVIPEIISTPGTHFIYATVELDALSPDYVELGRKRPNPGPLIDAVDKFLSEKIWELAKQINDLNKQELDESFLEEIQKENSFLNELKNDFLPKGGSLDVADLEGEGPGGQKKKIRTPVKWGKLVHKIVTQTYSLKIGKSVSVNLKTILKPSVEDINGKPIHSPKLEWKSANSEIISIDKDGNCRANTKGVCTIWVSVADTSIISAPIEIEVWHIQQIILSPRNLEIPVGHIKMITAQVTNDDGESSADVLLKWDHDADDKNLVKISPRGYIFGNTIGKTNVKAEADISCTNPCEINVVKSDESEGKGSGFPQLLLTGKDIDPFTGQLREGDPEAAALWQEPWDVQNNIWWLNLQSKDALFAYNEREENPSLWRLFHSKILVEMMIQVHMQEEYTRKEQKPGLWSDHKYFYDRKYAELSQAMWEKLSLYVKNGLEASI